MAGLISKEKIKNSSTDNLEEELLAIGFFALTHSMTMTLTSDERTYTRLNDAKNDS